MLLSQTGELLYANDQAARMFNGTPMHAGAWTSLETISVEYMPTGWQQDIREVFSRLLSGDSHVLLRTIWQGLQVLSWATLLERLPFELGVLPRTATWEGPARLGPVMLLTSRHVGRVCSASYFTDATVPLVNARVADLGPLKVLTGRELQVLALLGNGGTLSDAAKRLHRSEKTVDAHRSAIHAKLGITDRVQLAAISQRLGLTIDDVERMADAGQL
jgi:DNA-binding CsgD family transcriptional regulator